MDQDKLRGMVVRADALAVEMHATLLPLYPAARDPREVVMALMIVAASIEQTIPRAYAASYEQATAAFAGMAGSMYQFAHDNVAKKESDDGTPAA